MALEKGALQFLSAKETLHHLEEVFLLPILPLISSSTLSKTFCTTSVLLWVMQFSSTQQHDEDKHMKICKMICFLRNWDFMCAE